MVNNDYETFRTEKITIPQEKFEDIMKSDFESIKDCIDGRLEFDEITVDTNDVLRMHLSLIWKFGVVVVHCPLKIAPLRPSLHLSSSSSSQSYPSSNLSSQNLKFPAFKHTLLSLFSKITKKMPPPFFSHLQSYKSSFQIHFHFSNFRKSHFSRFDSLFQEKTKLKS